MSDKVFILHAKRTPIGRFGGSFKDLTAVDLGVSVTEAVLKEAGVRPDQIDEVIYGHARQAGCGPNPARQVAHRSGIPDTIPAFTVNKACGSGLKTIFLAAQAIRLGEADCILTGGMESMSRVPYMLDQARFDGYRLGHGELVDGMYRDGFLDPLSGMIMGETAEKLADIHTISRKEQDEFALQSQQKAARAMEEGRFAEEIAPITVTGRKETKVITADEHARPGTTLEALAKLSPVFRKDGTVTAGNSSGITDGASSVLVVSSKFAEKLGRTPLAALKGYAQAGVPPDIMGIGPVPATENLSQRTGLQLRDFEIIELNEAFAAQVIACERLMKFDRSLLNVNGGAIAIGHPIGCTGSRISVTLLHELKRRSSGKKMLGLATLCVSGGLGLSAAFESVS